MLIKVFGKDCNHGDLGGFIMHFTSLKIFKYHLKNPETGNLHQNHQCGLCKKAR